MEEYLKEFLNINNLSENALKVDQKLQGLSEKVTQWLGEIDEQHRTTFLILLKYFNYFNRQKVHDTFAKLYEQYTSLEIEHESTIYAPITPKRPIYNGTNEFFSIFREVCSDQVKTTRIAFQLRDYLKTYNTSEISNIVLVDDIIGTGTTLRDYLHPLINDFSNKIKDKKIYILCLVAHPKGLKKIEKMRNDLGMEIECLYGYELTKAFSKGRFFEKEQDRIKARQVVREYESKIAKRDDDIMGFQESEGLVAFFHNTPNNTLSTFWEQEARVTWHPIFPRTIRGDELPLDNTDVTLEAIKTRGNKKNNLAKFIFNKIRERLING
ncbi:hypothetical protein Back11_44590 [Paenibacillus baekrokdamisoli]|uniref:PRTase-CE domain-containing protein n=1 Tax=Paenibacillus baekrokdamisoli TaxID=1712516 RepID=A0A3G9JJF3_9BACL|nr:phosphoribosyltransferase [Paenibacillus baekrokdamisoli]MBB3067843.1 hypoxanthine phosphoribosyltransferase [Paenibacillus baekrokdamisoli]BBH23114.1 hypothetical protein Back11_44590 [Paenibacillus baekrokdamisoli]